MPECQEAQKKGDMKMVWYIRRTGENVTIFDAVYHGGGGNVRFVGETEDALAAYAASLQQCDEQRKRIQELEKELEQLKTQMIR